jgi:hypothetical protein
MLKLTNDEVARLETVAKCKWLFVDNLLYLISPRANFVPSTTSMFISCYFLQAHPVLIVMSNTGQAGHHTSHRGPQLTSDQIGYKILFIMS